MWTMMLKSALAATFLVLTSSAAVASGEKLLAVGPTSKPPAMDGELNDRCWRDAAVVSGFIRINGKPPTEQTTAYITYDDANIYIAFSCNENAPDKLTANANQRDSDGIFGDDNVELFLDTNCDRATYYHFAINSAGAYYEAYCDLRDGESIRKEDWDPDWEVRTRIGTRSWTAEIRIPFVSLGVAAPDRAAGWGVNFCRSWRLAPPGEFSTWAGPVGFNRPKEFGLAVFGVAADTAEFAQAAKRIADLAKGASGREPKIELRMDRYYYTPDAAGMQIHVATKTDGRADLKIEIRQDANTRPVAAREIPLVEGTDEYECSLDMTDWALGRYVVSAHLRDEKGATLQSAHRIFIKKKFDPAPASPSALNATIRSDGIILLQGKPFCPFGGAGWSPASPLAKDSFNLATYGDLGSLSIAKPLAWPRLNLPWVTRTDTETFILMPEKEKMYADLRKEVLARKSDPSLLCRLLKYEAHLPMYRGTVENRIAIDNVQECREINQFVKSVDPYHLTSIHVDRPRYLADYKDVADVVEVAYWTSSYAPSLIPNLRRDLEKVRAVIGPGRAFRFWIGSTIPSAEKRSAEEIRCACYLTLMYGAAGIGFNMGHGGLDPSFTRHWSVYPGLYRELMELFPILTMLQQEPLPEITIDPPEVDYCVRKRDGRLFLIAVNTSNRLINATVSIADRSLIRNRIELPFENREIKPVGSGFTDTFTAFEPHVYRLSPMVPSRQSNRFLRPRALPKPVPSDRVGALLEFTHQIAPSQECENERRKDPATYLDQFSTISSITMPLADWN